VRREFAEARRVVVKVGSSSLTTVPGGLDVERLTALVDVLGSLRAAGREVVLVSSGAIAAGLAPLGIAGRPRDLATAQAAASVGQLRLVQTYADAFARHGVTVGQVLLTADDVTRRSHYTNARRTLDRLLELGGWARPWDTTRVVDLPEETLRLAMRQRGFEPSAESAGDGGS